MSLRFFTAADGARLAYRDEGRGQCIIALAGLTRDGRDFDYVARHLGRCRLIRLDARGRGGSDWTGAATYTVAQESQDTLALMDHLGLPNAAILGSSRGGLIGMALAATARARVTGLCLNDVGPVLERRGLMRIAEYVGVSPSVATLEEVAERMAAAMPGFAHVPESRWMEETIRHYEQTEHGVGLTYDPALKDALSAAMQAPPVDLWPLFDACAGLPLALIRGVNSDVLSLGVADEMQARRPDMIRAEIPDRGHVPFLDEAGSLQALGAWLARLDIPAPPGPGAARQETGEG